MTDAEEDTSYEYMLLPLPNGVSWSEYHMIQGNLQVPLDEGRRCQYYNYSIASPVLTIL